MNILVSRHQGAIEWAQQVTIFDKIVSHFNINEIKAHDCIYGNLPIHIAAQICDKKARYFHLVLNITKAMRGQELTAEQLAKNNASFKEYIIRETNQ